MKKEIKGIFSNNNVKNLQSQTLPIPGLQREGNSFQESSISSVAKRESLAFFSTHLGMRYYDKKTYEIYPMMLKYRGVPVKDLQRKELRCIKIITIIDVIICILDYCVLWIIYVGLDSFLSEKISYSSEAGKRRSYVILGLSIINIILIIFRLFIHIEEKRIEYLLNILLIYKEKNKYYIAIFEVIIHIIMPSRTFSNATWIGNIGGIEYRDHLNLYLFILVFFRLYSVFRVMKDFSSYRSPKSKRIMSYGGIENQYLFIFRALLKNTNIYFVLFCILFLIIHVSMIITLFETTLLRTSFQTRSNVDYFDNYFNVIGRVLLGMISIRFGKNDFLHPVSQIIQSLSAFIGLYFFSLMTLFFFTWMLFSPKEGKCYDVIDIMKKKSSNGWIRKYMIKFIENKMINLKKKASYYERLNSRNNFRVFHKNNVLELKKTLVEKYEIKTFIDEFQRKRAGIYKANDQFLEELEIMEESIETIRDSNIKIKKDARDIKTRFVQITNLGKLIASVGPYKHLTNASSVKSEGVIKNKEIKRSIREFQVKYSERNIHGEKIILDNAKFMSDSDSGDEITQLVEDSSDQESLP